MSRSALRVCADPANLPFSSKDETGFENAIARLLASELKVPVTYTWFPQATGFIRSTLRARKCDIVMGYSQGHELVQNTNHYYRSTYVFLARKDGPLAGVTSLADPKLKSARIGIVAGTPPATLMARYGLIANARPFPLMVDRRHFNPAKRMVDEIANGDLDAGVLWGPIGGFHARNADVPIAVRSLAHEKSRPRMTYRITFGVRPTEKQWKRQLNRLIRKKQDAINKILLDFGVPILDEDDNLIAAAGTSN